MPPDGAGQIEDIAWNQDWIHMSRHFRVAKPHKKKITGRELQLFAECNVTRLYWSDKTKMENEIAKLRQSEQIKQQICMCYIYGSCAGELRLAMIANFLLPLRVATASMQTLRGVVEAACCQFMFLRIEMKFHYMRHNYERQVGKLQARVSRLWYTWYLRHYLLVDSFYELYYYDIYSV